MSTRTILLGAAALMLLAGSALAGGISPGLNQILARTDDDTPVKVMVFLREQVDVRSLNQELRHSRATRATRHNRVITELQDLAGNTQGELLATLETERGRGRVLGYTPHWLINGVVVVATKEMIHELAARDDVDAIEPDLVVELITPVSEEDLPGDKADRGIGITPGVVNIGARQVWEELGIRGEGSLVGTLDTGVQGSHPALASRWRGLSAPWHHAWLDVLGTNTEFPVDSQSHGTHVTGTIAGLAPDDTIGVAPAAEWLACNAINQGVGSEFDNDVIAALEWFADPDGDPNTVWDVPDVVQNSWGVNQNFSGYFQCDSRWWNMIDACEAAGVVLTWSAGNEGSGSMSLRSPADRATTLYNCFSVGSTIATPPFTISSFSSRGPAGPNCGPEENRMKPEIVAPGSDIYSAVPGGYGYKSGTSMSGPHIAGVVALMRSANPDLDVDTIKQVLMDTAIDLGPEGEDNTYGHGFVDAYMAVMMVMDGIGYLEGTVLADDTGLPIPGAFVDVVDSPRAVTADENGEFRMTLQQGTYDLEISAFGFETGTATVHIVEDETLIETFSLIRLPSATISGTVYDPDGVPAVGATVTAMGTPVPSEVTDGDGFYSILLPVGDTYTLRAITVGIGLAYAEVHLTEDVTVDLYMDPLVQESYETGDFAAFPWDFGGDAPWIVDDSQSYHGDFSARGAPISHNQSTALRISFDVAVESELSFFYKVSSEANYDYLEFWVNGSRINRWAGEVPWTEFVYNVVPGSYEMEWTYRKDGSVNNGADTGWIDLITFPLMAAPPRIEIDPPALSVTVDPDGTLEEALTVFNLGEAPLSFRFMAREIGFRGVKAPQYPEVFGTKGWEIPGDGNSPISSQGGPDGFGYRWIDSNEPGGPEYNWVSIAGNGTPLPSADDATYGPFPLGFTFNYYGVNYNEVRICTNGFLTFENTTSAPYANQHIPNTAVPNALVAPFWDDLNPNSGGTIYYFADGPNQRFIVQFEQVARYGQPGERQTFQAILTADGSILFQYHTLNNSTSCTVGIENTDGTDGLEVLYNTGGYLQDGMAILFTTAPAVPWISYDPEFGSVPGGEFAEVTVGFDATEMDPGEYSCELVVINNDPTLGDLIVPVVMVVSDGASVGTLPVAFTSFAASPNPFHPSSATLRFTLAASGQAELKLIDVQGRLVRTLFSGRVEPGLSEIGWDGRDNAGRPVASGTYYARLTVNGDSRVKPLVLVR